MDRKQRFQGTVIKAGETLTSFPAPFTIAKNQPVIIAEESQSGGGAFGKKSDPAVLPSGMGRGCGLLIDGADIYLFVLQSAAPYLTVYKNFEKIANPATVPTAMPIRMTTLTFGGGKALAAQVMGNNQFIVYVIQSGDLQNVDYAQMLPSAFPVTGTCCAMSGYVIHIGSMTSPYFFNADLGTGQPIPNPAIMPTGIVMGMARTGNKLIMAHQTSPYITAYDCTNKPYVKIVDPAVLPEGNGSHCDISPDGKYLAVCIDTAPYLCIYDITTTPFTRVANADIAPTGTPQHCAYSPDGKYLAVCNTAAPFVQIYDCSSVPYKKLAYPEVVPTAAALGSAWSADSKLFAVANAGAPAIIIYEVSGGTIKVKVINKVSNSLTDLKELAAQFGVSRTSANNGENVDIGVWL